MSLSESRKFEHQGEKLDYWQKQCSRLGHNPNGHSQEYQDFLRKANDKLLRENFIKMQMGFSNEVVKFKQKNDGWDFNKFRNLSKEGISGLSSEERLQYRDFLVSRVHDNKVIARVQANLVNAGYDLGQYGIHGVDGKKGTLTTKAIKSFQESIGLKPTGELDQETWLALELVTKAGIKKSEIEGMKVRNLIKVRTITNSIDNDLGILSAKYESKGEPGTIGDNSGDPGGKSYGVYQFASKRGTVDEFLSWLKNQNDSYWRELINAKELDGGKYATNFDRAWKRIAFTDKDVFARLQHNFIKHKYYDRAARELKVKFNFHIENRSIAIQNVLWSTAVQHGPVGAADIFLKAGLDLNDEELIKAVYKERSKVVTYEDMVKIKGENTNINIIDGNSEQEYMMKAEKYKINGLVMRYFSGCDAMTQVSVYERFQYELIDALNMYYKELENDKTGSSLL